MTFSRLTLLGFLVVCSVSCSGKGGGQGGRDDDATDDPIGARDAGFDASDDTPQHDAGDPPVRDDGSVDTPERDGAVGPADAGHDAGTSVGNDAGWDAGHEAPDAGDDGLDAGSDGLDAGSDGLDAGSQDPDAGGQHEDAGMDAGPTEPPLPDIRLNHVQVAGTHNSYHQQPQFPLDASHRYTHRPLDQQLEGGVRTLELDLHRDLNGDMSVYHIIGIDQRTSCDELVECLGVIKGWSEAHPRHTPIHVWFEIKNDTGGTGIDDAGEVDDEILRVFHAGQLVTPDSLRGGHASPRARIEAVGWPTLDEVRGKVMFILLNRDTITEGYTRGYQSLDGRLMFANTASNQYGLPWAVVTKLGANDAGTIASALSSRLLVAANICGAGESDDACRGALAAALQNGVHMLKDDFPFQVSGRNYFLQLPAGSPGCNQVTAPAGCTPSLLE